MLTLTNKAITWLECILAERFGHRFGIKQDKSELWLELSGFAGNIRFDVLTAAFRESQSKFPCAGWDGQAEGWDPVLEKVMPAPGVTRLQQPLIERSHGDTLIHYDILGLTYWMLSRLEEVGRSDRDQHNRFPATSSHAFKCGYLERPIVDEWLDILGQVICWQYPSIELRKKSFEMKVSHDVDSPSRYGFQSAQRLVRTMAGDVLKRRELTNSARAPRIWLDSRQTLHVADPHNTFDWLMDQSEQNGLTSAFYFICGRTEPAKDARYELEDPAIRALLRRINERGHEIGLHPSYNTYNMPGEIANEASRLRRVCSEEGINQLVWGGRMHYLRWEQPTTLRAWSEAGMHYDSTLGYADRPGFRCGTCHDYPAFDPVLQAQLQLRVRPLVAMECTVMAAKYMGLGEGRAAMDKFAELKQTCRRVDGIFTLLWHNSQLTNLNTRHIYRSLLAA